MKPGTTVAVFLSTILVVSDVAANHPPDNDTRCASPPSLIILRGGQLPALLGSHVDQIRLFRNDNGQLQPVPLQIDRKDEQDRYLLDADDNTDMSLDANDEVVFLRSDAGSRLNTTEGLVELELAGTNGDPAGWLYARTGSTSDVVLPEQPMRYYPDAGLVRGAFYAIGFSQRYPFLIDSLSWLLPGSNEWSPDVSDSMKIRHQGSLFGIIDFRRTQEDYDSQLAAVKYGALRVILRTENRVRIWWKLETPALHIDYVMMPDGFVMDSIIDLPFSIGLFMSEVETLTTVDWNQRTDLPPLSIRSPYTGKTLPVDGRMSPDKHHFNEVEGDRFSVSSVWGTLDTHLQIAEDLPIDALLYLQDNLAQPDPPEERIGQFGNVGFVTTGWEKIGTGVHHLKFTVCMSQ